VGVDGAALAAEGLPVRELVAGCICCSLRVNLVATLIELAQTVRPDWVLVEPSGVAAPAEVRDAFENAPDGPKVVVTAVLADAERLPILLERCGQFVSGGLAAADLIVVSKPDAVDRERLDFVSGKAAAIRPGAPVFEVCGRTGEGLDAFLAALRKKAVEGSAPAPERKGPTSPPGAVAWSGQISIEFSPSCDPVRLGDGMKAAVAEFAAALGARGCMIGHIKLIANTRPGGYWLASATRTDAPPDLRGGVSRPVRSAGLVWNSIVFGLPAEDLATLGKAALKNLKKRLG